MSASPASSSPTSSPQPAGPSRSSRRLSRPFWFGSALLLFLLSSWIAFRQEPCPNVYAHERTNPLYTDWWLRPIEVNAPLRLPEVQADLNDVFALQGTGHVWVVGSGGLILHSADGGLHWERQYLVDPKDPAGDQPVTFQSPPGSQPTNKPKPAAKAASLRPETVPLWRRMLPGNPVESALLVSLLPEVKSPPPQQQQFNPAQQSPVPSAQNTLDPKAQTPPQNLSAPPNSAASDKAQKQPSKNPAVRRNVQKRPPAKSVQSAPSTTAQPAGPLAPPITLRELANSDLYGVHFLDARNGWIAGDNGALFSSNDGGSTWIFKSVGWGRVNYRAVFFSYDPSPRPRGILIGEHGALYATLDNGAHWEPEAPYFRGLPAQPSKVKNDQRYCLGLGDNGSKWCFYKTKTRPWPVYPELDKFLSRRVLTLSGSQYGWLGDRNGSLFTTTDGGKTWRRVTRKLPQAQNSPETSKNHHIFPAPWYYLSLLAVSLLLVPAFRLPKPEEISESAADLLVSDNPINTQSADVFDFSAVALGLSRFLRNENTVPPLTIAVTGEWGSGKSSLMNLLRADLERYGFRPVWFNAWHHQKEENLLASLLETIRSHAIPPWWRPEGTIFRYKLLKIRWLRFWPVVTLVLIVFAFSLGYLQTHPSQMDAAWKLAESLPSWIADPVKWLTGESQKVSTSETADGHVPWIAFLLSSAGLLVSLWKGLKGFGVNPASLLAKDSRSAKVKDLENLTGFRYRFAAEFKDITEALNPRTLLILIDDLDRCKPEMVLEVLESVNFLVSSGDCFIVMGMARERVVRCVGLSFKDVASELLVTTPGPADQGLSPEESARRQRIEFAQQYLEKLINIEVPVPSPTGEQSRRLMLEAGGPEETPRESRARALGREAWSWTRRLLPFAAVVGLLFLGYWFGATRPVKAPAVQVQPAAEPAPPPAQAPVSAPQVTPSPAAASTKPLPTGPAHVDLGVEPRLPLYPAALLLIVLVGLGIWRLSIPPGVVLHDSPDFETALRTWHPLVFSYRNTPRSIKRFLNRVRYLAMLQRKQGVEPARWESLLSWLLRRPVGVRKPTEEGSAQLSTIPEDILVALAAIDHSHPEWLRDDSFFRAPQAALRDQAMPDEVRTALLHAELAPYRESYFRMSRGVHMS